MTEALSLVEQYKIMHDAGHFPGHSIKKHIEGITALVRKTGASSLLDYGCGKGEQYFDNVLEMEWGCKPCLYDLAVYPIKPKGKFEGVVCTDVLEHLEENEIESVVSELFAYAERFLFVSICTREAKKTLPDGRNCHLTIKPQEWWLEILTRLNPGIELGVEWNE